MKRFDKTLLYINSGIIEGILPKCNLINKNFSRIYFDIFANGKRDAKTISNQMNIGYRSVLTCINLGKEIGLLNRKSDVVDLNVDENVIKNIDNILINIGEEMNNKKIVIDKFEFINKNISYNGYNITASTIKQLLDKFEDPYSVLFCLRDTTGYDMEDCCKLLYVSDTIYNKYYINQNLKEVCTNMNMEDFFTKCPICGVEFDNINDLKDHIKRSRKKDHKFLKQYIGNINSYSDLICVCEQNKDKQIEELKPKKEKKVDQNKEDATKAFNYYYVNINKNKNPEDKMKSQNRYKEIAMLKSHLSFDMSYAEVIEVIDYLIKGQKPLLYFSNSINSARILKKCKKNFKIYGTSANLIRRFQEGIGEKVNDSIMLQGYRKAEELMKKYDYKTLEATVEYMIKKEVKIFNFIENYIEKAKKEFEPVNESIYYCVNELAYIIYNNIEIDYRYIYFNDTEETVNKNVLKKMKDDIINGRIDKSKIHEKYYLVFELVAKKIRSNKEYSSDFTEDDWLNIIGLAI